MIHIVNLDIYLFLSFCYRILGNGVRGNLIHQARGNNYCGSGAQAGLNELAEDMSTRCRDSDTDRHVSRGGRGGGGGGRWRVSTSAREVGPTGTS